MSLVFTKNTKELHKLLEKRHKIYIWDKGKWYLMKQEEASKRFSGEWLLLFNEEVVDHSSNVEDILKLAEEKYPAEKFPEDEIKISKVLDGELRNIFSFI